jgi:hypothetical protein
MIFENKLEQLCNLRKQEGTQLPPEEKVAPPPLSPKNPVIPAQPTVRTTDKQTKD